MSETTITAVDGAFGINDMFTKNTQTKEFEARTTRQYYDVDIWFYGGLEANEPSAIDAYLFNGFLKIVHEDGQVIYHNTEEIKSFVVTPL